MAAQNSQGISALLDSEKEAAAIVQKAREYRNQRIKDARGEASKEIEQLKAKSDQDYQQFEQQHSGDSTTSQSKVDTYTSDQLSKIVSSFESNKDKVVDDLLNRVVQVEPKIHRNYQH